MSRDAGERFDDITAAIERCRRYGERIDDADELIARKYNALGFTYNDSMTAAEHLRTVSRNGQVSIPAAARNRWRARKVLVVDLGDRVVLRPATDTENGTAQLLGKYAGRGPDTGAARRASRRADDAAAVRRG